MEHKHPASCYLDRIEQNKKEDKRTITRQHDIKRTNEKNYLMKRKNTELIHKVAYSDRNEKHSS